MLRTSGARFLFTVTDFLDTDYVALLEEAGARDLVEEIVVLEGSVPPGTVSWDDFLARGAAADDAEVETRESALTGETMCDIIFTSRHDGRAEGRDAAPRRERARRTRHGPTSSACATATATCWCTRCSTPPG